MPSVRIRHLSTASADFEAQFQRLLPLVGRDR